MAIPNVCSVANGKGGVLKTSTAGHIAAIAAASGWDVCVIDADGQGNLSRDLGYVPDGGEALAAAIRGGEVLEPTKDPVRDRLWYVSGGRAIDDAVAEMSVKMSRGEVSGVYALERALAPIADRYHLILLDSPPREILLRRMLLTASRYLVVPTGIDATGIDGLSDLLVTVDEIASSTNPDLELLGVVVGPVQVQAKRVRDAVRNEINDLFGGEQVVFDTMIRHAPSVAQGCRERGIVSTEYEVAALEAASSQKKWYQLTRSERADAPSFSAAASSVAEDWTNLVGEFMVRYNEARAHA